MTTFVEVMTINNDDNSSGVLYRLKHSSQSTKFLYIGPGYYLDG